MGDRDVSFLDNEGIHCSRQDCRQLNFLPFQCSFCTRSYCDVHWKWDQHSCNVENYLMIDNVLPSCPICSVSIPFPIGSDPNLAMDEHLTNACVILNPDVVRIPTSSKKSKNTCPALRCQTKMVVPIPCPACSIDFCAKHRFREQHDCKGSKTSSSSSNSSASSSAALAKEELKDATRKGMKMGKEGMAAIRRALAERRMAGSTSESEPSGSSKQSSSLPVPLASPASRNSSSSSSSRSATPSPVPSAPGLTVPHANASAKAGSGDLSISSRLTQLALGGSGNLATDRRSKDERASARKALEARAKRGLLTEEEKVRYATEQAKSHRGSSGNGEKGCIIV